MSITPVTITQTAATNKVFEPTKYNTDMAALAAATNALIAALESIVAGASGSDYVQCRPVTGVNSGAGGSLNTLLTAFKTYIDAQDAGIVSGAVPDGSITPAKLSFDPATQAELEAAVAGVQIEITGGASTIVTTDLTASKVLVSDAGGKVGVAQLGAAMLGYLETLTGNVQTQLNGKQPLVTGVSDAEIAFLDGVTSAIQTQLNGKLASGATAADSHKLDGYHLVVQADAPTGAADVLWIDI